MNATGEIIVHRTENTHGYFLETYEWVGGRVVEISNEFMLMLKPDCDLGSRFLAGPYKLRVVKLDHLRDSIYAIQERGIVNRLLYLVCRVTPVLEKIYRRLILTARIWGCANTKPENYPTWKDLHLPWRVSK